MWGMALGRRGRGLLHVASLGSFKVVMPAPRPQGPNVIGGAWLGHQELSQLPSDCKGQRSLGHWKVHLEGP